MSNWQRIFRYLRLPMYFAGFSGVFIVDRYLTDDPQHLSLRIICTAIAAAGVCMTLALSWMAQRRNHTGEANSWRLVSIWQITVFAGIVAYMIYWAQVGTQSTPDTFIEKATLAIWLSLVIFGLFMAPGTEYSAMRVGRGPNAEPQLIKRTTTLWLSMGLVASSLVCINYVNVRWNSAFDWSYRKTTVPSPATENLLSQLDSPLEIALFYSEKSPVKPLVLPYFEAVQSKFPNIKIRHYDFFLDPQASHEYLAARNGIVGIKYSTEKATKKRRIDTGTTLVSSRAILRRLDLEFQRRVMEVSTEYNIIYFTRGHGEMTWDKGEHLTRSLKKVELFLSKQNYLLKTLSLNEGSASEVPKDAAAVIIAGPTTAFLQAEADALEEYMKGGGSLFVWLEGRNTANQVESMVTSRPLMELLGKWGFTFNKTPLANERIHGIFQNAESDRWFLLTKNFTSHESVSNLAQNTDEFTLGVLHAGSLQLGENTDWTLWPIVNSEDSTFLDTNRNFRNDDGEPYGQYIIGAVGTKEFQAKTEKGQAQTNIARVFVFAGASALSDAMYRNQGNAQLIGDGFKWTRGDSELMGVLTNEEDIRIVHTKKSNALWFNLSTAAFPIGLLLIGFFATRGRKKSTRQRLS